MISVLYVDDEGELLELGKLFLEKSGQFHVDTVTSAPEALQILKSTSYDAVVSDYQMPEMNGIAFLKEIRAEFPDLPFIIFTGKGREDVVIEAFDNGADFYLQKGGKPTPQFLELGHKITAAVRRRQAEKALKASEQRYRNIIEDQTEFICRFRPDGTHVFVNDAYCRYFNKTREEIIGYNFRPELFPEDRKHLREMFASLTPEKPVGFIRQRVIFPDGSIRWQRWVDRAIYDESGTLVEYQSVGRDITDVKTAELALAESEQRYRNIIEDQTEFICRFKPDGIHNFVNDAYCRYFGIQREEIIGHKFIPKIPEEDKGLIRSHFASLTGEHPVGTVEHRIIMSDGDIRWQQWSDRAIFNDSGTLIEFQSVGRDITERKHSEEELRIKNVELRAAYEQIAATEQELRHNYNELDKKEQKLRESEQLYRTIVETTPGMLIICDSKGRNLYASANCMDITGYTQEELLGKIVWWVHEDDTPRMEALLKDTLENQISGHNVEFKGIKKDGEIWYGSQSWEPIKDTQGTLIEFVMQVIDITDRKKMEETLEQSEHRFSDIINNLPDATLVIDPNGKVIAWNKAIEEMTGVKAREMVGKGNFEYAIPFYGKRRPILIDLIFKSDEEIAKNYSGITRKRPNVLIAKTTLPQPKGKKSILWGKASPLYDDLGNIVGAIESIRDVTDHKEA